ncbi:MAG TPA: peptidase domain-containing ABC transporter [Gemmatimonadaceae bacterium]|nr:peptidase domain-containing ABC transporter [Gemmatimonadaceae bacterium]
MRHAPSQTAPVPSFAVALRQFTRLLLLIRPYWVDLAKGLALGIVVGVAGLVTPYFSKSLIDDVYPRHDYSLMHLLVIALAVVTIVSALTGAIRSYYSLSIGARLNGALNLAFLNHVQHLPARFFDEHRVGEVLSRFGDARAALTALSKASETLLINGVYLLLVPPVLFLLNWRLALVSICTIPITTVIATLASRGLRKHWKLAAEAGADLSAFQVEVFSNIRVFKSLAAEQYVYAAARDHVHDTLTTQLRASGLATILGLVVGAIRTAGTAVFTWYAWTLILRGDLTLGEFIAFSAYTGYLSGPLGQVAALVSGFQQTSVSLGRMFEYLDEVPEAAPTLATEPRPVIARPLAGALHIRDVSFSYVQGRPVLENVSLECDPGTVTAVVGPTGVGKSSLLRLICRLSDPAAGEIRIGGRPIAGMPLSELRSQVGVVWQEIGLLRGSLRDNLTLGLDHVDPDWIDEAVRVCQLDGFIQALPDGFDTPVGEWGATLSGGQRQRIAIARALVRQPPILLLDEVTSQLDPDTESELLRQLIPYTRDKLVLIVTHRPSTAALADRVCVLDRGRIAGLGGHTELVASCEPYRRLMRSAGLADETRHLRVLGGQT